VLELQKYSDDIQELETTEQAMVLRGVLQDAQKYLRELISELDINLIRIMREQNVESFEWGFDEDTKRKVYVAKEKKEKITDTRKLRAMLTSDDQAERELSHAALSSSQSAWKMAQVKILADTLGLNLIETTYGNKVVVKEVPVKLLKQGEKNNG